MYSIVEIYSGTLANEGHEGFRFTIKGYGKVYGVLYAGKISLSLAFKNGREILLRGFEMEDYKNVAPCDRPFFFKRPLEQEVISGVVKAIKPMKKGKEKQDGYKLISIYLLMKES